MSEHVATIAERCHKVLLTRAVKSVKIDVSFFVPGVSLRPAKTLPSGSSGLTLGAIGGASTSADSTDGVSNSHPRPGHTDSSGRESTRATRLPTRPREPSTQRALATYGRRHAELGAIKERRWIGELPSMTSLNARRRTLAAVENAHRAFTSESVTVS